MSNESEFSTLLRKARNGDHDALAMLLDQYREYLLAIANAKMDDRIRSKLGSSDIVQDSLISAQKHFIQFEGDQPDQLKAWLKRILSNDVVEAGRHYRDTAKRRVSREQAIDSESQDRRPIIDPHNTPRTHALQSEESVKLEEAMSLLSEPFQTVLRLRNWEQLSFKQIGEKMDRSEEAARKLWTRAILRLQELLAE